MAIREIMQVPPAGRDLALAGLLFFCKLKDPVRQTGPTRIRERIGIPRRISTRVLFHLLLEVACMADNQVIVETRKLTKIYKDFWGRQKKVALRASTSRSSAGKSSAC